MVDRAAENIAGRAVEPRISPKGGNSEDEEGNPFNCPGSASSDTDQLTIPPKRLKQSGHKYVNPAQISCPGLNASQPRHSANNLLTDLSPALTTPPRPKHSTD